MSCEGYTISDDYLSISFEGMKEARKKIISSINAKKAQSENISRAIESLEVPDSVLRGYGNDLIPIKNSICKDIDELMRMSSHVDYVMRRFEEVDNEYAARFKSAGYGIQEKLGLQRESGIFGCCIAGLTPIVSQVTKVLSGRNNALEKKTVQLTYSSSNNKNTGKSLLITGSGSLTAQAEKLYFSQKSSATTNYSVNEETKGKASKIKVFSKSELRSLEEQLNNSYTPEYVKILIKKYITDAGATYYFDPKTGEYVVKNKGKNGTVPIKIGNYWAPPSINDWSIVKSKLDPKAYNGVEDPSKYLRFPKSEQTLIDPVFAGRLAKYAKDHGIIIYITSNGGKRSYDDQVKAYKASGGKQDKNGNWYGGDGSAAVPGTGWHELGFAIDIDKTKDNMTQLRSLCADEKTEDQGEFTEYGLFKPMTPGNGYDGSTGTNDPEPWHIQALETDDDEIKKNDRFKVFGNTYTWGEKED